MSTSIALTPVTLAEVALYRRLARRLVEEDTPRRAREWLLHQSITASDAEALEEIGMHCPHFIWYGDALVGLVGIVEEGDRWLISRIAILRAFEKHALATEVFRLIIRHRAKPA